MPKTCATPTRLLDTLHLTLLGKDDDILLDIQAPEARAIAYRLVNDKDPTPEQRRKWYKHKEDRYRKKEPEDNALTDLSIRLRSINESTTEVVKAMVSAAKQLNVWDGDISTKHDPIFWKAKRWSEGQSEDGSRQQELYDTIIAEYRFQHSEAMTKAAEAVAAAQAEKAAEAAEAVVASCRGDLMVCAPTTCS